MAHAANESALPTMSAGRILRNAVFFVLAISAPAAAAFLYPRLSFIAGLPYGARHFVAPSVYSFCIALAATAFEFRTPRRIVSCAAATLVLAPGGILLDALFVLYAAVVTGFVAVGAPQYSFLYNISSPAGRHAAQVAYRLVRGLLAGALALGAIFVASLAWPSPGVCPSGGGDITGFPGKFTFITYAFVLPVAMIDWLTGSVE